MEKVKMHKSKITMVRLVYTKPSCDSAKSYIYLFTSSWDGFVHINRIDITVQNSSDADTVSTKNFKDKLTLI